MIGRRIPAPPTAHIPNMGEFYHPVTRRERAKMTNARPKSLRIFCIGATQLAMLECFLHMPADQMWNILKPFWLRLRGVKGRFALFFLKTVDSLLRIVIMTGLLFAPSHGVALELIIYD